MTSNDFAIGSKGSVTCEDKRFIEPKGEELKRSVKVSCECHEGNPAWQKDNSSVVVEGCKAGACLKDSDCG